MEICKNNVITDHIAKSVYGFKVLLKKRKNDTADSIKLFFNFLFIFIY